MENGKRVAVLGLCLLVVLALAAEAHAAPAQCNLNSLWPCYTAVQGATPYPPSRSCCNAVRVVDKNCLCRQFLSGSFPPHMVKNAMMLPKKCQRNDLAGFRCGAYTIPK